MARQRRYGTPASAVRPLRPVEWRTALELCRRDPVGSVMVAARIEQLLRGQRPPGEVWGYITGTGLEAVCWSGANLIPAAGAPDVALRAFADYAAWHGRHCSALCGPRDEVLAMWRLLREHWSPIREIRSTQPSLAIAGPPLREPDPQLRQAQTHEFEAVFDACVRMFTEEVGYSPLIAGDMYRARVAEQVKEGGVYVRTWPLELHRPAAPPLVFKGEVGAQALGVAQLQGLWVEPSARRHGYGAACVAGMVQVLLDAGFHTVSLYVNDYNTPARRMYASLGFSHVGDYATVLF